MGNIKIANKKLERDMNSKAILNTNRTALEQYKIERKRKQAELDDINNMKEDIKENKLKLVELKEMIGQLLGKQNG
jgi:hypothetical protein